MHGITVVKADKTGVTVKISTDGGEPSKSGKMILTASTGGWKTASDLGIEGASGFRINLTAGNKVS